MCGITALTVIADLRYPSVLVTSDKSHALAQDAAADTAFTSTPFVVTFGINSSFSLHFI